MAVLLLNASMQPLNVISHRRLIILLSKERVAFLDERSELEAAAALDGRRLPEGVVIVRLLRTIHVPRRLLRPNRRNLLLRDDHTCQYCSFTGPSAELTIDHIVPVSRGGAVDRWENLVVACKRCNWRKANHRPEEVGMHLRRQPGPLTQEYAHIIFLRYPELKAAYERLLEV
ncbi:MAG: HNH endonuclease [Candidatus Dormibacteraeota bacterium]|nr:HNH endonuclease [Candidatus Dormibacteraeota bacterium]